LGEETSNSRETAETRLLPDKGLEPSYPMVGKGARKGGVQTFPRWTQGSKEGGKGRQKENSFEKAREQKTGGKGRN